MYHLNIFNSSSCSAVVKMMFFCINLLLLTQFNSLFISLTDAFGVSPPLSPVVCATLTPLGHWSYGSDPSENLDFEISTSRDWFVPNETISITLSSPSGDTFKGLILQVRDKYMHASGMLRFSGNDYQHLRCEYILPGASYNGTVGHKNSETKSTASFTWIAPPSCVDEEYVVAATLVKSRSPNCFQTGLKKFLKCRTNPILLPSDQVQFDEANRVRTCRYHELTSIPNGKYETGFETEDLNGWNNTGWSTNTGYTSSIDTGPTRAAEGDRYLYFESSSSPSFRRWSSLETEKDLRGCFCVELQEHHNVESGRKHQLRVTAGDELIYEITNNQPYWKSVSLQVDTDSFVKIKIVGYRGENFRGDMALDDIRITAGLCSQEEAV